jgi:hypothetical protein
MTLSSRDPVAVARAARRLIHSGDWRQQIANDDRTKVLMSLKARMPWAVGLLPVDGLLALTKELGPGRCGWCAAKMVRSLDQPELPRNETTIALLGAACADCRQRWEIDTRAAELVAAAQEREALTASLCRGRPWLAEALAVPAHSPRSLHHQMDRDVWTMGAHRAAAKWGVPVGLFTGDRAAIREVARHPVWGPALTKGYGDA